MKEKTLSPIDKYSRITAMSENIICVPERQIAETPFLPPAEIDVQYSITACKTPTNTSRGRYNWARPAALKGRPLVGAGFPDRLVTVPIVIGPGNGDEGMLLEVGIGTAVRSKFKMYQRTMRPN
jgi:hypothetical protein